MADPLDLIAQFESGGGQNIPNYRFDARHTAFGPWQVTDSNWKSIAPKVGIDLSQYPTTRSAPVDMQRKVAQHLYDTEGYAPWAPYNPKLASAIGWKGAQASPEVEGIVRSRTPQEQAGFGTPIEIRGHSDPGDLLNMLLASHHEEPAPEPKQEDPLALLDTLLPQKPAQETSAQAAPQEQAVQLPPVEAPKLPGNQIADALPLEAAPLQSAPPASAVPMVQQAQDQQQPTALLDRLLSSVNPISTAQAAPAQPAAAPAPQHQAPIPAPEQLLNSLLQSGDPEAAGAAQASRMMQPAVKGGLAAATGRPSALERGAQIDAATAPGASMQEMMKGREDDPMGSSFGTGNIGGAVGGMMGMGRGPGFMPKTPATGPVGKAVTAARENINAIFSPTTVDPFSQAAEADIRKVTGRARRETEIANAALEEYRPIVNQHVPEFTRWLDAKKAGTLPSGAPDPALLKMIDFMEGRSTGSSYAGPPELKPVADTLRAIYKQRSAAIAAEPTTAGAGEIEDYYPHLWKETSTAQSMMAGRKPKQGSGAPLKERSIPTLREGIDRGLTPVTLDPIDMTMRYVANMDRYLAHNRAFSLGEQQGAITFHHPGGQPEGWVELQGRRAQRGAEKAYAPEAYARVYNNFIDPGFYATRVQAGAYQTLLHMKNALTSAVLGFPGFHASAMAQEASASALARAIGGVTEGDIAEVTKQLGLGGMPVAKSVNDVVRTGRKLQRQYAGIDDYGPDYEHIARLLAEGGGRIVSRGQEWKGSTADNWFKLWTRRGVRVEAMNTIRDIKDRPIVGLAGTAAREIGRIMETIGAGVFDGMIPRLKAAAFFDEMSAWLKQNPGVTRAEQQAKAREIVDVVDDRFGEMIMDNIFWGKRTKQTLQILTVSQGWELGTMRSGLGAAADVARGKWTPRTRYLAGLATSVALYNSAYQYIKTGTLPDLSGSSDAPLGMPMDLLAPRTGGVTPQGAPERALLPGYEKDALGWWHNPTTEWAGKLSPLVQMGQALVTGKDYFGHEIAPYEPGTPDWFKAYGNYMLREMVPIPLKSDTLRGSNIGQTERWMGGRPAPGYLQDPQRADDIALSKRIKDLKSQARGIAAHGANIGENPKETSRKVQDIMTIIQKNVEAHAARQKARPPMKMTPPGSAEMPH